MPAVLSLWHFDIHKVLHKEVITLCPPKCPLFNLLCGTCHYYFCYHYYYYFWFSFNQPQTLDYAGFPKDLQRRDIVHHWVILHRWQWTELVAAPVIEISCMMTISSVSVYIHDACKDISLLSSHASSLQLFADLPHNLSVYWRLFLRVLSQWTFTDKVFLSLCCYPHGADVWSALFAVVWLTRFLFCYSTCPLVQKKPSWNNEH